MIWHAGSSGKMTIYISKEMPLADIAGELCMTSVLARSLFCVILSAAKNPGSFSAQNTSTSLGACEAELLRIQYMQYAKLSVP